MTWVLPLVVLVLVTQRHIRPCFCLSGHPEPATTQQETDLIAWLLDQGSEVNVEVKRSSNGLRGLYTSRAVEQGGVLVRVPLSAAVALGAAEDTGPELAVQLLRERYRTRPRYGPYFAVLPPPPPVDPGSEPVTESSNNSHGSSASSGWLPSCVEELCDQAVQALAGQDLRRLAEAKREWMRTVWSGTAPTAPGRLSLARAVPRRAVSLREFAWATCMVTSRSISGPGGSMLMIPLIDLANHCSISSSHANGSQGNGTAAANPRVAPDQLRFRTSGGAAAGPGQQGAGSPGGGVVLELVAGQALAAGDEVCISYGDLTPDETLLYYGFVPDSDATAHGANVLSDHLQPGEKAGHHHQPQHTPRTCPHGSDPASAPLPPGLMAIDQREYDSTARAGKVSYSPLGPGASRAELEAELSRLRGRLEGVRADMAMAREAYLQLAGACGQHLAGREGRGGAGVGLPEGDGRQCKAGAWEQGRAAASTAPSCAAEADGASDLAQEHGCTPSVCAVARLNVLREATLAAYVEWLECLLDGSNAPGQS